MASARQSRPQRDHSQVAQPRRRARARPAGLGIPYGRPVERRGRPGRGGDRRVAAGEVVGQRARAHAQQAAVAVAVQGDDVPGVGHLPGQRGVAADLLPDEEERRPRAVPGQDVEHRRRALRVRPVVEGQVDAVGRGAVEAAARRTTAGDSGASAGAHQAAPASAGRSVTGPGRSMGASSQWTRGTSRRGSGSPSPPPRASRSATPSRRARRDTPTTTTTRPGRCWRRLVRRRAWRGGTLLVAVGVGLQLVALGLSSVAVVQPTMVLGLGLLVVLAERRLGERVRAPRAARRRRGGRRRRPRGARRRGRRPGGRARPPRARARRARSRAPGRAGRRPRGRAAAGARRGRGGRGRVGRPRREARRRRPRGRAPAGGAGLGRGGRGRRAAGPHRRDGRAAAPARSRRSGRSSSPARPSSRCCSAGRSSASGGARPPPCWPAWRSSRSPRAVLARPRSAVAGRRGLGRAAERLEDHGRRRGQARRTTGRAGAGAPSASRSASPRAGREPATAASPWRAKAALLARRWPTPQP